LDQRVAEAESRSIPGTVLFDGNCAMKGYNLNRMCFSFNSVENRNAFKRDEATYCRKFDLNDEQTKAIRERDVLALLEAGGNIYYLAKFAGIFGLGVQDLGAQQTGMSVDDFRAKLLSQGR
jgi:protocatechuate 4,5-dioxygenase, alpha chain